MAVYTKTELLDFFEDKEWFTVLGEYEPDKNTTYFNPGRKSKRPDKIIPIFCKLGEGPHDYEITEAIVYGEEVEWCGVSVLHGNKEMINNAEREVVRAYGHLTQALGYQQALKDLHRAVERLEDDPSDLDKKAVYNHFKCAKFYELSVQSFREHRL